MRARKGYLSPLCLLSSQRVDERLREAVEVSGECWSMEHRGGESRLPEEPASAEIKRFNSERVGKQRSLAALAVPGKPVRMSWRDVL